MEEDYVYYPPGTRVRLCKESEFYYQSHGRIGIVLDPSNAEKKYERLTGSIYVRSQEEFHKALRDEGDEAFAYAIKWHLEEGDDFDEEVNVYQIKDVYLAAFENNEQAATLLRREE